jgi:Family of unknown function (DUF5989)
MQKFRTLGRLVRDLFEFMNKDKLWWISPIIVLLVVMSVFLIVVEGSALAPLIYAMF